jgi:hypothetical protein
LKGSIEQISPNGKKNFCHLTNLIKHFLGSMTFSLKALHLQSFNLPAKKFLKKYDVPKSVCQKKALNESVGANQLKTERKLLFSHKTFKLLGA